MPVRSFVAQPAKSKPKADAPPPADDLDATLKALDEASPEAPGASPEPPAQAAPPQKAQAPVPAAPDPPRRQVSSNHERSGAGG